MQRKSVLCFILLTCFFWRLAYVAFALVVLVKFREGLFKVIAARTFEQQLLGKTVVFR